jgi:hypothetical protein
MEFGYECLMPLSTIYWVGFDLAQEIVESGVKHL